MLGVITRFFFWAIPICLVAGFIGWAIFFSMAVRSRSTPIISLIAVLAIPPGGILVEDFYFKFNPNLVLNTMLFLLAIIYLILPLVCLKKALKN